MPSAKSQIKRLMAQALEARRQDEVQAARGFLRRVVDLDPRHEQAWLLLVELAADPLEALMCLEKVLGE